MNIVTTDGVVAQMPHEMWERTKARIAELEAALMPLAVWGALAKAGAPGDQPLPVDVPHLSLTIGHARAAAAVLGDSLYCPVCQGACSTQH